MGSTQDVDSTGKLTGKLTNSLAEVTGNLANVNLANADDGSAKSARFQAVSHHDGQIPGRSVTTQPHSARFSADLLPSEAPAEPEPPPQTRLLAAGGERGLVYSPKILVRSDEYLRVVGRREVKGRILWGFWGGLLIVFAGVFLVTGARYVYQIWDILWVLTALAVGVAMFRFGRRSSLESQTLCEVDLLAEHIRWPSIKFSGDEKRRSKSNQNHGEINRSEAIRPDPDIIQPDEESVGPLSLPFESLTEVVFAMIDYPLSTRKNDVRVDAFTLLVRDRFERLIPVIEATPNKKEAHQIAKILAGQLNLPVSYVGKGFD